MSWNMFLKAGCSRVAALLTVLCAALVGCIVPGSSSPAVATGQTSAALDCQALKNTLVQSYFEQLTEPRRCGDCLPRAGRPVIAQSQSVTGSFDAGGGQASSPVAIDGRGLVYSIAGDGLSIRRLTSSGEIEELGKLPLALVDAELFLDEIDARVMVTGQESLRDVTPSIDGNTGARRPIGTASSNSGRAVLVFVNVSAPAQPVIMQRLFIDGMLIARAHAHGQIHLVTRTPVLVPGAVKNNPGVQALVRTVVELRAAGVDAPDTEQALRGAIELALTNDVVLAQAAENASRGFDKTLAGPACANIVRPAFTTPVREMVTLTSLSADGDVLSSVAVLGAGQGVYATQRSLYVLQTLYAANAMATAVSRFELNAAGADYKGSAVVNGALPGLAGIDEHDGVLRIVTTNLAHDGMRADVTLSTLNAATSTGVLEPLATSGLVRDTLVSAVKFLASRLFIATHAAGETLHVFDIEDARQPLLLAEHEYPASVDALVVLGGDRMLSIGHTLSGLDSTQQLHLGVLDKAIPASQPQVCERSSASSMLTTSSLRTGQYDEQELAFYEPLGLLAIPVTESNDLGELQFRGTVVYDLNHVAGCKELARSADANQTVQESFGRRVGIVQVGKHLFLLMVAAGELTAMPLNRWPPIF